MTDSSNKTFRLGPWLVEPDLNRISLGEDARQLEPKTMAVLVYLCDRPGAVVSADEIIEAVWSGRPMGDNPVYKAIAKLRGALDDEAGRPRYIATVPKKGYRIVGQVRAAPADARPRKSAGPSPQRPLLWIAAGLAAGVLVAGALFWQPRVPTPGLTLLSTFPGSHTQPSFGPDGAGVAFVSDAGGRPHVWVLDARSTLPRQLTAGESADARPRWSPDGRTILFARNNALWSVAAGGGDPVEIVRDAYNPDWAGDGRRIVFERRYEVWTADPDGGRQERVTGIPERELPLAPRWPALSPDGTAIAYFDSDYTPEGDLWVIDAGGGTPRRLTAAPAMGGAPVWGPDGESLYYTSERGGSRTLWRVSVATGDSEALLFGSGDDDFADVSSDGRRLIYANSRQQFSLLLSDPETGDERTLHAARQAIVGPELSPDGQTVAFFGAVPAGGYQIFTLPVTGGTARAITADPRAAHALPQWSADGEGLYFFHVYDGVAFSRIPTAGGDPAPVVPGWHWDVANGARVSPDQTRAIYSRLTGQIPVQTLIRDLSTGEDLSFHGTLEYPRWSPDGRQVLGSLFRDDGFPGDVAICPVAGPPCRILAERARIPVRARDGSGVYFVRGFGRSQDLFVVPADGSGVERRLMSMAPLFPLGPFYDVTADGRVLWIRHEQSRSELWIAELPGG